MAGKAQEHMEFLGVVIVGDNGTGKTALRECLVGLPYRHVIEPTFGIEIESEFRDVVDASGQRKRCRVNFHDCGQTTQEARFVYYKLCSAALVVYDTTRRSTFANLTAWLDELFDGCFPSEGLIVIVGTKRDCVDKRQVSLNEGHEFAKEKSTLHEEVSVQSGENMEALRAALDKINFAVENEEKRTTDVFECYRKGDRWLSKTGSKLPWSSPDFEVKKISQSILGCGTFGVVYRAQYLGTDVAAKVHRAMLHPEEYDLVNAVARSDVLRDLIMELRALKRIKHQHVVNFIAIAWSSEVIVGKKLPIWIITALADCGSIYDAIHHKDEALSGLPAQELTRQVASGLRYLHARSIVHRDVKSKNLLVMSSGRVVIADLGLARLCRHLPELTGRTGTLCGTPHHIGPEGAQSTSFARDIYALGCVLCEAVLHKEPDQDRRQEQMIQATSILEQQGLHMVAEVMRRSLEDVPEARPSAATVVDTLWNPNALVAWIVMVFLQHDSKTHVVEDCCRQLTSICQKHPLADGQVEALCRAVGALLVLHSNHVGVLLESVRLLVELFRAMVANARVCCGFFAEHDIMCYVVEALKNHPHDAALTGICTALLADVCQAMCEEQSLHKENIVNAGGLSVALTILATHFDQAVVQEHGYRFLGELCHGVQDLTADTCRQSLAKGRVVRGLVKALQLHAKHVGVQKAGITCLVNLCKGEDCHVSHRRQAVCASDALLAVVSAARLHHDEPDIQDGCKDLISELASETDDAFLQTLQRKFSIAMCASRRGETQGFWGFLARGYV